MRLDILIPTFNRASLLGECIAAVLRSTGSHEWRITVIDNNSKDDTKKVVESFDGARVRYLFERKQGRSAALNAGVAATDGDVIGMIDDDERVHPDWIETAAKWMSDAEVDFIGGPYLGLWEKEKPRWMPAGFEGVLGADDPESIPKSAVRFPDDRVFLRGGNIWVRRSVFDRIGLYRTDLGRGPNDLASCEDQDMYTRLLAAGLNGSYVPELIIYHLIPPERLTRSYYRRWAWDHAKSLALLERGTPRKVAYLGRVPRYLIGTAIRKIPALASPDPGRRFSAELEWRRLAGFLQGAYSAGAPAPQPSPGANGEISA